MKYNEELENIDSALAEILFMLIENEAEEKFNAPSLHIVHDALNIILENTKLLNTNIKLVTFCSLLVDIAIKIEEGEEEEKFHYFVQEFYNFWKHLLDYVKFNMDSESFSSFILSLEGFPFNIDDDGGNEENIEYLDTLLLNIKGSNCLKNKSIDKIENQVLLFEIKNVIYGISSNYIEEIKHVTADDITPIPKISSSILGLFNLRGNVIPLIDLRLFFGIKTKDELNYYDNRQNMIIAVIVEKKIIGLVVDKATDFTTLSEDMSFDYTVKDIKDEYINGIGKTDEYDFIINLNIENFLNSEKLKELV